MAVAMAAPSAPYIGVKTNCSNKAKGPENKTTFLMSLSCPVILSKKFTEPVMTLMN